MRAATSLLPLIAAGALWSQDAPDVKLMFGAESAKPGETVSATVLVRIPPGLHAYSNPPTEDTLIPLAVTGVSGAEPAGVTYPPGEPLEFAGTTVGSYQGEVRIPTKLKLPASATGSHRVEVTVHYQLCDDTQCFFPGDVKAAAAIRIAAPEPPVKGNQQPDQVAPPVPNGSVTQPDGQVEPPEPVREPVVAAATDAAAPPAAPSGFGERLADWARHAIEGGQWWIALPLFLLAGLIINLTPCVYPVIAPTAGFIAKQSEGVTGGRLAFGLTFLIGAAVVFGAVGTIFGYTGTVFGSLFQHAWFTIGLGVLMLVLALAMFDVYQLKVPDRLASGMRGRGGLLGALVMGMFIGVAAVPCGGPVIALAAALVLETRNLSLGAFAFTTMGVGLALPVTILIMTGALGVLARPGEWMVTVKHVLGLAVIASGIYFLKFTLEPLIGEAAMTGVWMAYLALAGFYLLVFDHTGRAHTGVIAFKSIVALGAVFYAATLLAPFLVGERKNIEWEELTLERFDAVVGKGEPVVVDFGADWCAQCLEIEHKTFSQPKVQSVLGRMVRLRADYTNSQDPRLTERFDAGSLPTVLFYDGEGRLVRRFKSYFGVDQFFDAARRAGASVP